MGEQREDPRALPQNAPRLKRTRLKPQSDNKRAWKYKYHVALSVRRKAQVAERGHTYCERCDRSTHVEGHHPDGQNGELIMHFYLVGQNCCHDFIHFVNPNAARAEGWLRAKNAKPKTKTIPMNIQKKSVIAVPETAAQKAYLLPAVRDLKHKEQNAERAEEILAKIQEEKGRFETNTNGYLLIFKEEKLWRFVAKLDGSGMCGSFEDAVPVLQERFGSRATLYRMLAQTEVAQDVGEVLPATQAAALIDIPAPQRAQVLEAARDTAREEGKEPTTKHVEAAAAGFKKSGVSAPVSTPPAPPSPAAGSGKKTEEKKAEPKKDPRNSDKYREAIARLGKLLGKSIKEAIADTTLEIEAEDVITWAKQSDDDLKAIVPLVVGKRWKVKKALALLKEPMGPETTIEEAINLAIVSPKGVYTATVNGASVVITAAKADLKHVVK
jgi:hypothetical protein